MRFGADAVEADQFAGHVEAGDLFASVLRHDGALQEAEAHRVQRVEAIAAAEKGVAALARLRASMTSSSRRSSLVGDRPTGRHSSRRLQFEQATRRLARLTAGAS